MNSRRVNRSKKVPGVKLRPADPAALKDLRTPDSTWANSSGLDSDEETTHADLCPRPFKGIVLCATGIKDKTSLFKLALELGAQSMSDLTDQVTHLIAEEAGSPKYRCALENGIPIMHPSWIIDSHQIWLRGDDVDVKESVERHRLPPFNGIVLCITGIKEMHRRTEISSKVIAGGGKYVREIERPVRVTHLLCGNLIEGNSEKVHYAEKFNRLGEARIHIVWEDWFWDSLRFGGRFNEETYKVSNPRPPPRALPEAPPPGSCPTADVTGASSELAHAQASAEQVAARSAKLHNQADEEEEIASVKRVPAVTLGLWESILKPRGFEVQQGRLVRSPSKSQYRPDTSYRREPSPSSHASKRGSLKAGDGEPNAPVSAISAFRKARSFARAPQNASTPLSRQLFKRAPTAGANAFRARSQSLSFLGRSVGSVQAEGGISSDIPIASTSAVADPNRAGSVAPDHEMDAGMAEGVSESARELFKGKRIRALGEARCMSVRRAIEECGGTWVSPHDDDDRVDFTIVRLVSGSTLYRNEGDEEERVKYRSECWLEHCITEERICMPEEHIAFVPLPIPAPVPGTEDMMVSYSGLDQSEACWIRRLLRALGIEHAPNFSRRTTHLLCPSGMGAKADKAREWGTPIVNMEWLASIAHRGVVPSTPPPTAAENVSVDQNGDLDLPVVDYTGAPEVLMATQQPAKKSQGDLKAKGKGKAGMADITNEDPAPRAQSLSYYHPPLDEPQAGGEEHESFGIPSMLLDAPLPSDQPATPRRHSKAPTPALQSDADAPPPRTQSDADQSSDAAILDRLYEERVPSSESPSPMRMPGERTPTTPRRFVRQPTIELQQRITTLLGKRTAAQMETQVAAVRERERKLEEAERMDARDARFGKRPRPLDRSRSHISLSDSGTPGRMSPDLRSPMPVAPSRKGSVAPAPPVPMAPAPVPEPAPKPVPEPEPELELELEPAPAPEPELAPALPAPSKPTTTSADAGDNSFVVRKVKGKSHVLYADPHQNGARTRLQQILDSEDGEDSPGAGAAAAGEANMDVQEMTLVQLPDVVAAPASGSGAGRRPARGGRRGRGRKGARS